jgi:hypothetical protein
MAPIASRIGHDTPSPARPRIATARAAALVCLAGLAFACAGCVNPFLPAKAEPPPADGTNVNIDLNYSDPDAVTTTFAAGVGAKGRGNGRAAYLGAFADSLSDKVPYYGVYDALVIQDRTGAGKDIPVWNRDLEAAFYPYLSSLNSGEYVFKWSNYSSPSDEIDDVAGTATIYRAYELFAASQDGLVSPVSFGRVDLFLRKTTPTRWAIVRWTDIVNPDYGSNPADAGYRSFGRLHIDMVSP